MKNKHDIMKRRLRNESSTLSEPTKIVRPKVVLDDVDGCFHNPHFMMSKKNRVTETKTFQRLTLDDIRKVFPNVRIAEEDDDLPLALKRLPRKCVICGIAYNGWPESEYCSDECVSIGHRKHNSPSRERIKYLRGQCRLAWQRTDNRAAPESFETWLRNFEAFIERMREQPQPTNQKTIDE